MHLSNTYRFLVRLFQAQTAFELWTAIHTFLEKRQLANFGRVFSKADLDTHFFFSSGTPAIPSVQSQPEFTEAFSVIATAAVTMASIATVPEVAKPWACDTVQPRKDAPRIPEVQPDLDGPREVATMAEITINIFVPTTQVPQTDSSPCVKLQKPPHELRHGEQESNLPPPSLSPIHYSQPALNPSPGILLSTPTFTKWVREFDRVRWRWRHG